MRLEQVTNHKHHCHAKNSGDHDKESGSKENYETDSPPNSSFKWYNDGRWDSHDAEIGNNVHDQGRDHVEVRLRFAESWRG